MPSSWAAVTPSGVAGLHFGALSFSTITARTPSMKSWLCTMRAPMRYSMAMFSAKVAQRAPRASWRRLTFMVVGDLVAKTLSCSFAQSVPAPFSAAMIASRLSPENNRAISSWCSASVGRPASPSNSVSRVSVRSGAARIAAFSSGSFALST